MQVKKIPDIVLKTIKDNPQIAVGFAIFSALGISMLGFYIYKNRYVHFAKKFIGQKEIAGNMGFQDAEFDRLMRKYGDFRNTQSWCSSFVKMVMMMKVSRHYEELIDKLITPSTQQTLANFKNDKSGLFEISNKAHKGDIAIWQKYKNSNPTWQGHLAIVDKANKKAFNTIEGNTNSKGGREGIEVAYKERKYDFTNNNGLRLKGFIHLKKAI